MLDPTDPLDEDVANVYSKVLVEYWGARDARPDAENIADMRATIMRLSHRLADDRNNDFAVYLIDIGDDGGPAKVFVDIVDDHNVVTMFQIFDGNASIMYSYNNGEPHYDVYPTHAKPTTLTPDERRELDATNMHEPGPAPYVYREGDELDPTCPIHDRPECTCDNQPDPHCPVHEPADDNGALISTLAEEINRMSPEHAETRLEIIKGKLSPKTFDALIDCLGAMNAD